MNYTPIQLKLPVDMERIIEINDSVYTFKEVVSHIDLKKYFVEKDYKATGRPRYEREKLLKVLLFAFMEHVYIDGTKIEANANKYSSPAVVSVCIFNEKVIHSPNELKKAEPFQLGRDSAFFLRGYLTAPIELYNSIEK